MVTVQHVGAFSLWQQQNQFSFGSVVPCQWHGIPATVGTNDLVVGPSTSYVSPQPVQHQHQHHYQSASTSSLSGRGAATVDPEQPIGFGSFGVVW